MKSTTTQKINCKAFRRNAAWTYRELDRHLLHQTQQKKNKVKILILPEKPKEKKETKRAEEKQTNKQLITYPKNKLKRSEYANRSGVTGVK